MVFTLYVLCVELVYLLGEVILFNGLSAGNRKRKTPFKVLHLVHGAERQTLRREREREIKINNANEIWSNSLKICVRKTLKSPILATYFPF